MASLVADYGDSSGNSEEDEETRPQSIVAQAEGEKVSVNFFGDNNSGADSEDSDPGVEQDSGNTEESQEAAQQALKLPNPFLHAASKLPAPLSNSGDKSSSAAATYSVEAASSVFVNPFRQAEQAKLGILEKHVRLTEAAPKKPASKQVCFKFKKGLCHLGTKCRFFHDRSNIALGNASERAASDNAAVTEHDSGQGFGRGNRGFQFPGHGGGEGGQLYHPAAQFSRGQPADPRAFDEDNYMNSAKRKKRHGVADDLVPPKKALTELEDFRKKERPWTTKK